MKQAKLKLNHEFILDPSSITQPLDFTEVFGNENPVEIEIGSGKGTFIVRQASAFPDTNFIGIEWASRFYRYAVDRLGRWNLKNAKMLRTDAAVFIPEYVPAQSVSCFHIYFPDPWPKKRHHRRRFICQKNLEMLHEKLTPCGTINIATDHKDYFDWMLEHIAACSGLFKETDYILPAGVQAGEMAGTNFERKYLKEARAIYTIAIRKI